MFKMQKQLEQCVWGWMMDYDLICKIKKSMLKKEESVEVGVR